MRAEAVDATPAVAVRAIAGDERPAQLAQRLQLSLTSLPQAARLLFSFGPQGLELQAPGRRLKPLRVDFTGSGVERVGSQLLLRAARVKTRPARLLDLTAGLGADAWRLAQAGFIVTAIERQPLVHALLEDALTRAPRLAGTGSLQAVCADARSVLGDLEQSAWPEVVYLDPMFPEQGRTALPRRELQLLRELTGDDDNGVELATLARMRATRRVVVKRPLHAPPLLPSVDVCLKGRAVRFDVYLVAAGP
ncbi:class I SAM-dependent methyltransferase [Immundisolibacter sp.]|uniref:class I SAM-dependent methyltransferase n=1 Tax=Immundisolibacter sp. TaxID=1934948 RepID=UPI0035680115